MIKQLGEGSSWIRNKVCTVFNQPFRCTYKDTKIERCPSTNHMACDNPISHGVAGASSQGPRMVGTPTGRRNNHVLLRRASQSIVLSATLYHRKTRRLLLPWSLRLHRCRASDYEGYIRRSVSYLSASFPSIVPVRLGMQRLIAAYFLRVVPPASLTRHICLYSRARFVLLSLTSSSHTCALDSRYMWRP